MKKFFGSYFLGHETVKLYYDDKPGDAEAHIPGDWERAGKLETGQIIVRRNKDSWAMAVEDLLHETFEYAAVKEHCRYTEEITINKNGAHGLFVMTHEQFTQICAMAGNFLQATLPAFVAAFNKKKK